MTHSNVSGYATRKEFIETYFDFVAKQTENTGLLPETVLTAAILESSGKFGGKWLVGGSYLSRAANNYFGVKCGKSWTGAKFYINTGEQTSSGANYVEKNACFRKYPNVEASIQGYINLITKSKLYKNVLTKKTPFEQFKALKAAGYATAVNYANTLNDVYKGQKSTFDALAVKKKSKLMPKIIVGALIAGSLLTIYQLNFRQNEKIKLY
jgi:flagellum-specific peptidoglycan hydrolase FlgJ